jgi:hypothetical protein
VSGSFFVCVWIPDKALQNTFLHAKAEAPLGILYPKLVNGAKVFGWEFFDSLSVKQTFLLSTSSFEHDLLGFPVCLFPLPCG